MDGYEMKHVKFSNGLGAPILGALLASRLLSACSAGTEHTSGNLLMPPATGGSSQVLAAGGAAGFAVGTDPANGATPFLNVPTTGGAPSGGDGASTGCPAIRQKPEQVVTYKPVALFIMQDRSGSMVTGFPPPASAQSWQNSTDAITAFVNDPMSQGIDIGLGTFPAGMLNTADCQAGSDCGSAVVPIAALPGNAAAMTSAMTAQTPNSPISLTPTECGLRGMINGCLTYQSSSPMGERCVAVLVTDGSPTQCDTNQTNLIQIIADGHMKGIDTYTLGLPGADLNVLNQYAQAGGTNMAIDVTGGAQAFISALNSIRKSVTISMPLPCTWKIPAAPAGTNFDPTKVNVQYTAPGGSPQAFGYVASEADCARASGDAWYYDNSADPSHATQVLACPNSCNNTLHNATGEVNVLFGCETIPATIR
jgi:hypothetical protein